MFLCENLKQINKILLRIFVFFFFLNTEVLFVITHGEVLLPYRVFFP